MTVESRKRTLQYFYARVVDALGHKFTPDEEPKDFLLEQEGSRSTSGTSAR